MTQAEAPHGGSCADGEQLRRGSGRGSTQKELRGEHDSNSTGRRAQGAGDTVQDPALPPGQAEARRAQNSKDTPAPS